MEKRPPERSAIRPGEINGCTSWQKQAGKHAYSAPHGHPSSDAIHFSPFQLTSRGGMGVKLGKKMESLFQSTVLFLLTIPYQYSHAIL